MQGWFEPSAKTRKPVEIRDQRTAGWQQNYTRLPERQLPQNAATQNTAAQNTATQKAERRTANAEKPAGEPEESRVSGAH